MTLFTHILEIVVLVILYVGLMCAVGTVLHEEAARSETEPYEQQSHVRVLRGDKS